MGIGGEKEERGGEGGAAPPEDSREISELLEARCFSSSFLWAKHSGQFVGTSGRWGAEKEAGRNPGPREVLLPLQR